MDRDPAPRPPGRGAAVGLAVALAAAVALRLLLWSNARGALWFEEDVPVAWAWGLWGFDRGGFDPNPHNAIWPHLSVYLAFAVQAAQYAAGRLAGAWTSLADFRAAVLADPRLLRGAAMLAWTATGAATIGASAVLARRVAGAWAAVAVALVLACDPLALRYSLAVSPDMPLTFCGVMGLLAALDVAERGRWRDSLAGGAWLGLGAAFKYSPILLAIPLVMAHAARPGGMRGPRVAADPRLWAAAGVSLAAFAAGSPFTLVDLATRWSQFQLGASVLVQAPAGAVRHWAAAEFLAHTLPGDLGWPLWELLAFAMLAALVRGGMRARALASFALANLVVFGAVPTAFARYLLPAYPPMLALGAMGAAAAWARPRLRLVVVLAVLGAAVGFVRPVLAFVREYERPDSRAIAREWFLAHVPSGSTVLLEFLGPELPERAARNRLASARGLSPGWRARLLEGPSYYVSDQPLSFPAPEVTTPFYVPTRCSSFDMVVTSGGASGRYRSEPARFPVQCDGLAAFDRYARREYRTVPGTCTGPAVTVYGTSDAARAAIAAWWAGRPAAHDRELARRPDGFEASQFAQRAYVLSAGGRWAAALDAWNLALSWKAAPQAWRDAYALCAERAGTSARTTSAARR